MAAYVIPVYVTFKTAGDMPRELHREYHFSHASSARAFMEKIRDIPGVLAIESDMKPQAMHSAISAFELFTAERI